MATAKRFARAVGMEWTEDRPYGTFIGSTGDSPAVWMISIAARDGEAVHYHVDAAADYVFFARAALDSARQTSAIEVSADEAMERAARAVEATGIARDQFALRMLALECEPVSGAQRWRAEWERTVGGERVGPLATVLLDAESGALLQMMTAGRHEMPADLAIDRQEAIRLALEAGTEALGTPRVEIEGLPELRPVPVDGGDNLLPAGTRMAWSVVISTQRGARQMSHLWIDANDGSLLGSRGYGRQQAVVEERRARQNPEAGVSAQPAKAASGYLVAAIAGMAGVVAIVVFVVWPRRRRTAPSDG